MLIEHRLNYDCAVIELRLSNVWANLELSSKPKLNNLVLVELTPNVQHTQYQQIHQQLEQLKAGSIKVHETQAVTELSKQKIQWLGTRQCSNFWEYQYNSNTGYSTIHGTQKKISLGPFPNVFSAP